jgi:flagellar biosynthesis protein FlhB
VSDDKPFEATPQRIAKARREGNVARAGEFVANLAFAAAAAAAIACAPVLGAATRGALLTASAGRPPWAGCALALMAAAATLAAAALTGVLASALQNGGIAFAPLAVKLERLNPLDGLKRMLSRETFAHAARSACAFAAAAAAMCVTVVWAMPALVRTDDVRTVAAAAWRAAEQVAFVACAVGLLFACAEFAAAHRAWLQKLRMSYEERKRDAREQEGDPFARARRRAVHRSLLRGSLANVKKASFVVVNPTHVAVALEYRPPAIPVPRVLVRAADRAALQVRALADRYRVPVIADVALAHALYAGARAGDAIPHEHYVAVAEIVVALLRSGAIAV